MPAVSVIIPTYGRTAQLQACLEALACQDLEESWDIVVVDDGSPAPVSADVTIPPALDGRVLLLRQDNAGPSVARNLGAEHAAGEFVAFTDDDCRPDPSWLSTLLAAAREHPGALVGGTTYNGLDRHLFPVASQLIIDLVYEHFNANPSNAYFLASNNILCARARFREMGGFDGSFPRAGAEDREFCDRWRMSGWPMIWRPSARVEHRHGQNLRQFIGLHYRYGRGAYMYQLARRRRHSGTMADDLGFHRTLARRLTHRVRGGTANVSPIAMLAALGTWQVANAAGFVAQAVARLSAGRTASAHTE